MERRVLEICLIDVKNNLILVFGGISVLSFVLVIFLIRMLIKGKKK